MEIVIVTGMSGAGKTLALKCLEDLDYYAIDNLPASLLTNVVETGRMSDKNIKKLAVVMDVRGGVVFTELLAALESLESTPYTIIFLDAPDEVLLRRFSETRRIHPLQSEGIGVASMIASERKLLNSLRERSDIVIDTGGINVHELQNRIQEVVGERGNEKKTKISLMSFGYKHGHPLDADIIFDVRFLPNPFWVQDLRDLKGDDRRVKKYVLDRPGAHEFIDRFKGLIEFILPGYQRERRPYLSIGIGCTGGRHRSVVIATELSRLFAREGHAIMVSHRDIDR